jgi:hypothetical protein
MYEILKVLCNSWTGVCIGKLPIANFIEVEVNLYLRSVGQFALVSDSHLEPMTRFFFFVDCGFVDVGYPL